MTRSGIKNHGFFEIWRSLLPVISVFYFFDFAENIPNRERKKSFGTQKSTFLSFFGFFWLVLEKTHWTQNFKKTKILNFRVPITKILRNPWFWTKSWTRLSTPKICEGVSFSAIWGGSGFLTAPPDLRNMGGQKNCPPWVPKYGGGQKTFFQIFFQIFLKIFKKKSKGFGLRAAFCKANQSPPQAEIF